MGDGGAARWINSILVGIVFFIGLHVLFVLFDGNPRNGIVKFVGSVARVFIRPFIGIFDASNAQTRQLIAALIAVIVYSLLAGIALAINRSVRTRLAHRRGDAAPGAPTDVDTTRRA